MVGLSFHSERTAAQNVRTGLALRELRVEPFIFDVFHDVGGFGAILLVVVEYSSESSKKTRRELKMRREKLSRPLKIETG